MHVHIFGGVRVRDGAMSRFHRRKKKDKMHAHICGGGRVSDGVVSPFAQKKTAKCMFTFLVELGFEMGP